MLKISRKALPGLVVILAMLLGAWTAPAVFQKSSSSSGETSRDTEVAALPSKVEASQLISSQGNLQLSGILAQQKGLQARVNDISSFKMNFAGVNKSNVTDLDKQAVEDGLTSNSLELWTMEYAMKGVQDASVRSFIKMMMAMHSEDQRTLIQLANQLGVDTSVDFTNASVFPETPDWDLGIRTQDLTHDYLDHLVEKSGNPNQSFDDVAMTILDQEHTSDVQDELTQERMVTNPALKSFIKHSADVTELHLQMLDVLQDKLSQKFDEAPSVDFQSNYMSPWIITVNGHSNSGQGK